jgi:hypothetical protein
MKGKHGTMTPAVSAIRLATASLHYDPSGIALSTKVQHKYDDCLSVHRTGAHRIKGFFSS